MGLEFINRVARVSIILALIQLPFVMVHLNWQMAIGILMGCLWGAANLMLIKFLIIGIITSESASKRDILILGAIKFPLLYGIGYLLLKIGYFSPISLLIGFTNIFFVAFLKAMGRFLLENKIISTELPRNYRRDNS